jgi:hypothetical protein
MKRTSNVVCHMHVLQTVIASDRFCSSNNSVFTTPSGPRVLPIACKPAAKNNVLLDTMCGQLARCMSRITRHLIQARLLSGNHALKPIDASIR